MWKTCIRSLDEGSHLLKYISKEHTILLIDFECKEGSQKDLRKIINKRKQYCKKF